MQSTQVEYALIPSSQNRWLLVEFLPIPGPTPGQPSNGQGDITSKQIWAALKQSVITHFGDTGWGAVGSSLTSELSSTVEKRQLAANTICNQPVKYFSPRTNLCIIRVARDPHKLAWASVSLMTTIDGKKFIPHVVHVSGTSSVQFAPCSCLLRLLRRNYKTGAAGRNTTQPRSSCEVQSPREDSRLVQNGAPRLCMPSDGVSIAGYQDSYEEFLQTSTQEIEALQD